MSNFNAKKGFVYGIILFVAIILQTSFLPLVFPGKFLGDIVLMLVLAGVVLDGFFDFLWLAVLAGMFYDLVTYTTIGTSSLIFLLVVYLVSFFSRRFSVELRGVGLLFFMAFVIAASVVSHLVGILPMVLENQNTRDIISSFGGLKNFSLEIFYNSLLFFACFVILKKAKNFFTLD